MDVFLAGAFAAGAFVVLMTDLLTRLVVQQQLEMKHCGY
jgi:hypothetical protein